MIVYDSQYEQLAIGLMLNNQDAAYYGLANLEASHFFEPNFKIAFIAIDNLSKKQKKIDIYNVNEEIKTLGKVFSLDELISIEDKFYIQEKFDTIIDTLRDRKKKREAIQTLKTIEHDLQTSTSDYEEIIKDVGNLYQFTQEMGENILSKENYIETREKHDESKKTKIPIYTGYYGIDSNLTYKLSTKEISVIGARPSNGKSAFKANLIRNLCKQGIGVVSYALEQSMEVESDRLESIVSGVHLVDIVDMKFWKPNDERKEKLKIAREEIANWNYYLISGFNKTLAEFKGELRFLKAEGIKIVFWDLFDRMKEISRASANKAQVVTNMLNQFLALANELDMHFCLLVQNSRETTKKKKNIKPTISELKDSGGYEEVARIIFLLHYQKHYEPDLVESILDVKIGKQANGKTFEKSFSLDTDSLRISESDSKPHGLRKEDD